MRVDTRRIGTLVVDEDLLDGELIAMMMSIHGFPARAVRRPREALEALAGNPSVTTVLLSAAIQGSDWLIQQLRAIRPVRVVLMLEEGNTPLVMPRGQEWLWKSRRYGEVADQARVMLRSVAA